MAAVRESAVGRGRAPLAGMELDRMTEAEVVAAWPRVYTSPAFSGLSQLTEEQVVAWARGASPGRGGGCHP